MPDLLHSFAQRSVFRVCWVTAGVSIGVLTSLTAPLLWSTCIETFCGGDTYVILKRFVFEIQTHFLRIC